MAGGNLEDAIVAVPSAIASTITILAGGSIGLARTGTGSGYNVFNVFPGAGAAAGNELTINGTLIAGTSGSGFTVQKIGGGTLLLSGAAANTFTEPTTVLEGTLVLAKSAGVNALTGTLIVGAFGNAATVRTTTNFNNLATATLRKSAGTGVTEVQFAFNNLGTVEARSGTLSLTNVTQVNAGASTLTGGTWNVFTNSTLTVNDGVGFANNANITLDGANSNFTNLLSNAAAGNFTIQNGRNFNPAVAFNNAGHVFITAGTTFTLTNGGASTGDWDVAATGALKFTAGTYLLDDGTDITGGVLAELNRDK